VSARLAALPVAVCALIGCAAGPVGAAERLTVLATASMQEALHDLARAFRTRHAGVEIEWRFTDAPVLGVPAEPAVAVDVLVSADTLHAAALERAGRIGTPARFATAPLVVITLRDWLVPPSGLEIAQRLRAGLGGAPGGGDAPGGAAGTVQDRGAAGQARAVLQSLARPGARIALMEAASPAGRHASLALERMAADPLLGEAFRGAFQRNVTSREAGTRAVLLKVARGEADGGFVYATDAGLSPSPIGVTPLPPGLAVEAEFVAAVVAGSKRRETAGAFVEFLSSDFARSILRRHGFGW
jgi:molybdate transport system substrate-binding protein